MHTIVRDVFSGIAIKGVTPNHEISTPIRALWDQVLSFETRTLQKWVAFGMGLSLPVPYLRPRLGIYVFWCQDQKSAFSIFDPLTPNCGFIFPSKEVCLLLTLKGLSGNYMPTSECTILLKWSWPGILFLGMGPGLLPSSVPASSQA